jgi:hypothetical protein
VSETTEKKPRTNKVAEAKAELRAQLAALANKVPEKVNAGSIQTTHEWVEDNKRVQHLTAGGYQRKSRRSLQDMLAKAKGWHS